MVKKRLLILFEERIANREGGIRLYYDIVPSVGRNIDWIFTSEINSDCIFNSMFRLWNKSSPKQVLLEDIEKQIWLLKHYAKVSRKYKPNPFRQHLIGFRRKYRIMQEDIAGGYKLYNIFGVRRKDFYDKDRYNFNVDGGNIKI